MEMGKLHPSYLYLLSFSYGIPWSISLPFRESVGQLQGLSRLVCTNDPTDDRGK